MEQILIEAHKNVVDLRAMVAVQNALDASAASALDVTLDDALDVAWDELDALVVPFSVSWVEAFVLEFVNMVRMDCLLDTVIYIN